ncbi:unnamed protein product, partial [Phaedon cochleariae]
MKWFLAAGILSILAAIILDVFNKFKSSRCHSTICLVGKTVIVTGANTGIGYETALDFARRGARVILACRDEQKAEVAREKIIQATQNQNVVVRLIDFASLESVREFAKETIKTEKRLDILVNNAGVGDLPNVLTEDGLQILMQVNYFGPVLLTLLLLDLLKKTRPSRIVNVSSLAAKWARLEPEHLNHWSKLLIYSNSKLGNLLFTIKLASVLRNSGVSVFSVHPGIVKTEIMRTLPRLVRKVIDFFAGIFMKVRYLGMLFHKETYFLRR